jgi:hypothetical protein
MSRCLDDIFDIQDAIVVLEKLELDSPVHHEEHTEETRKSKFRVLFDLYDQLESHIEHDIEHYTKSEIKKLYRQRFIDKYDILDKTEQGDN